MSQETDYDSHPTVVAQKRALIREETYTALFEQTKRARNSEVAQLREVIVELHKLIKFYDLMPEPPPVAGAIESAYDASIERLREVIAEIEAARRAKEEKRAARG